MSDPLARTWRFVMWPFFQLIAVLAIVLAGASIYIVANDVSGGDIVGLVTGSARFQLTQNPPIGSSALTAGPTWEYHLTGNPVPWRAVIGNNGATVFASAFQNPQNSLFLFSTQTPSTPSAPVTLWQTTKPVEDSRFAQVSAAANAPIYGYLREIAIPSTSFYRPVLERYSTSATPDWTYTFGQVSNSGPNNPTRLLMSESGKMVVTTYNTTAPTGVHVAVFSEAGGSTPQYYTFPTISGLVNATLSDDGSTLIIFSGASFFIIDTSSGNILYNYGSAGGNVYCLTTNQDGSVFAYGGINNLYLYEKMSTGYTLTYTHVVPGSLPNCTSNVNYSTLDMSKDGKTLAYAFTAPNDPVAGENRRVYVGAVDIPTKVQTMSYTIIGSGTNQNIAGDVSMDPAGGYFAVGTWGNSPQTTPQFYIFHRTMNTPLYSAIASGSISGVSFSPTGAGASFIYREPHANLGSTGGGIAYFNLIGLVPTPPAPTNFVATSPQHDKVSLSWNSPTGTAYDVFLSKARAEPACDSGGTPTYQVATRFAVQNATVGGPAHTFTGLTADTRYYAFVRARNALGTGSCAGPIGIKTAPNTTPSTPTLDGIVTGTPNQLTLNWSSPGGFAATGYNIWRSTSPGVPVTGSPYRSILSGTQFSFTDTQVVPGTVYYYRVTAYNTDGESGGSNILSATPLMPNCGPGVYNPTTLQCELTFSVLTDDVVYKFSTGTTNNWLNTWAATSGTVETSQLQQLSAFQNPTGRIEIPYLTFDTALLPDSATVRNAYLNVSVLAASGGGDGVPDYFYVEKANNVLPTIGDNYEQCGYPLIATGQPVLSNTLDISQTGVGAYSFLFTDAGKAWVNKTGQTKLCVGSHQSYTGQISAFGFTRLTIASNDATTSADRPKLVVGYV